ncbi:MAG: orotate phosphoribosyltransferase, partial [Oscillospiraceae bacterium]|nr:orotate phosphoribosyltransferase [Oscillospiraceae bacterium]
KIAIIEDVVTAGTAVRESIALLTPLGVTVNALFVSVDRCEKGNTDKSALRELHEELNIGVYSIVTSRDILESLPDGGAHKSALAEYLSTYAASS